MKLEKDITSNLKNLLINHLSRRSVLFFEAKPAAKEPWTKEVWIYDYRTNVHHTLKKNPMKFSDLEDFIKCYNPENRHNRKETWSEEFPEGRFRKFSYEEIVARVKRTWTFSDSKIKALMIWTTFLT